jgi:hypothetical protein
VWDVVGHEAPRDEKDDAALQRHGQRDHGVHDVQRIAADPRAHEHGEQVQAGRVVDHLAEIRAGTGIVDQAPVLFEVREEREVVREVRTGARREKVGARAPHQPGERDEDDRSERDETRGVWHGATPEPQPHPGRGDDRDREDGERRDGHADPVGEVCGDDG